MTEMGPAATSQTAVRVIPDQEEEEIQQPLPSGPFGITGTFPTKRHVTHSSAQAQVLLRERILLKHPKAMQV